MKHIKRLRLFGNISKPETMRTIGYSRITEKEIEKSKGRCKMKLRIECDGEKTRVWLDDLELTDCIKNIEFKQDAVGLPLVNLSLHPVNTSDFLHPFPLLKDVKRPDNV